jgi:pimeloyl-ACP methyl ester carboxylesterase
LAVRRLRHYNLAVRLSSSAGVELELHDLGGSGTPLLIAHATGFCAGAYLPFAAALVDRFHVWALDFRGHGLSTPPADGDFAWTGMADDVRVAVDAIGGPVAGFGHSMGGAALAAAELARPGTLRAALLFEPIILPFDDTGSPNFMAIAARRRRDRFPSRADALARYAHRPPLGTLRADALYAYVEHGFRDDPEADLDEDLDPGVVLRCTPEAEAATFEGDGKPRVEQMAGVQVPVTVALGERDGDGPARFAPLVADAFPQGTLRRYAHLGHFGPLEDPPTVAADVADALDA